MSPISIDILLLIADHVHDVQDYFRMMRVCRGWHATLSPRAYNRMSIQNNKIYAFASHIYKNPSLGSRIRNLHLSWEPTKEQPTEEEMKETLGQDAVRRAYDSDDEAEDCISDLQAKDPDAWLGVLLQSLEGVTSLSLNYVYSYWFVPMIERVALRKPPFDTAPVLQNLRSVTIYDDYGDGLGLETRDLIPFFWLPAMRVVIGHGIIESWSEAEPEEHGGLWGPGKSGVREIRLGGPFKGCNGDEGVSRYITYCANLEIFEYQHEKIKRVVTMPGQVSPGFKSHNIWKALVAQKHSLRELRLNDRGDIDTNDYDHEPEGEGYYESEFSETDSIHGGDTAQRRYTMEDIERMLASDSIDTDSSDSDTSDGDFAGSNDTLSLEEDNIHPNKFGSLAEFCQLRELRIPTSTIFQYDLDGKPAVSLIDVLPPSLEYLHLSHCEVQDFSMMRDELYRMVEYRTKRFPNLRRLCIRPFLVKELQPTAVVTLKEIHQIMGSCTLAQKFFAEFADVCHDVGVHFWVSKGLSPAGDEPFQD